MEQMYMIEIFIDKVTIFASEEDEKSGANKNLIIKIRFGPKVQFIIKEGQLALNEDTKDDIMECDENGRRKWTRTIRVGKSYLFPSYPDTVLMILSKFPLEIEVWNDDENEVEIFVGIGNMYWDTQFFHMLKETAEACKIHEPLTVKHNTPLFAECCCKQVGEISFILRLSALGESIITEFQQPMKDPDTFVFRTNKAPSMFQCKRIEGDDPNFCMVGSLYETTTLEDPTVINDTQQKIEICTELQSCGIGQKGVNYTCRHDDQHDKKTKKYPIDKIRMGDITGPCGNKNCPLAHKVRTYIRNFDTYKKEAEGKVTDTKGNTTRKICGTCDCKDDRWHREECPELLVKEGKQGKVQCSGWGGTAQAGKTYEDRKNEMFETGLTPKSSKTHKSELLETGLTPKSSKTPKSEMFETGLTPKSSKTHKSEMLETGLTPKSSKTTFLCVLPNPGFKKSAYGRNYIVENMMSNMCNIAGQSTKPSSITGGCCCQKPGCSSTQARNTVDASSIKSQNVPLTRNFGNQALEYSAEVNETKRNIAVYNCFELPDEKDCRCNPPKPSPPCKTFDCECITETANIAARKMHKPYCPSYKHKINCPVTMMQEEDLEKKLAEDDENEAEPLPYGLPPIKLGPCPVLGRPCSVPDGFARMYKTAALPAQPLSYSDAGKVCCSKEYERIKKAIKDYMKYDKDHDYRCVNKFNVDTEKRCCDKEQKLLSLMGQSCCGSHKLAIQEKYKEDKKNA